MTGIRCIPCTPCSAADSCSPAGAKIKPRYLCMKAGESRLRAGSDVDVTTMMARGAGRVGDVMMRSYRSRQKTLMCWLLCCWPVCGVLSWRRAVGGNSLAPLAVCCLDTPTPTPTYAEARTGMHEAE